jgi:hypothetical protein
MDEFAPNFDAHYQKLLAVLKERAALSQPDAWSFIMGQAGIEFDAMERDLAYCENVALLSTQLIDLDLRSSGIDPALARLIVLARLLSDDAPVSHLREELAMAAADVIELRSTTTGHEAKAPVLLFTARMRPITAADCPELFAAGDDTPNLATAPFDADRWSKVMALNLWGTA